MKHAQRIVLLAALAFAAVCVSSRPAEASDFRLLRAAASYVNPSGIGAPKAVVKAARAALAGCRDSVMIDGDHYREATWALGSCELDAVAMVSLAWDEGRHCTGGPPACPRGDHGHSAGTWQVQGWVDGHWDAGLTDLYERDLGEAAKAAYTVIRWGAKTCPDEPLAPYCGGCGRTGARELAHARLERAEKILEDLSLE